MGSSAGEKERYEDNMNLKVLFIIIVYWVIWIAFLTVGAGSYNPLLDANYSVSGDFNTTGFTQDEIDPGGFFSTLSGIFVSMFRITGLVFFGVTPALTGLLQLLFSLWQSGWTLFTIGFIISAFWDG